MFLEALVVAPSTGLGCVVGPPRCRATGALAAGCWEPANGGHGSSPEVQGPCPRCTCPLLPDHMGGVLAPEKLGWDVGVVPSVRPRAGYCRIPSFRTVASRQSRSTHRLSRVSFSSRPSEPDCRMARSSSHWSFLLSVSVRDLCASARRSLSDFGSLPDKLPTLLVCCGCLGDSLATK